LLGQTPLSLGQRRMLAELRNTIDNQKNQRAAQTISYPVETPDFHRVEFVFAEIIESAFDAVRAAAVATGTSVRLSQSGPGSSKLVGCAELIHQMINLLATSPLQITTGITAIALQSALKTGGDRYAEMELRITVSTDREAQDLVARLLAVTTAATALQAASFNETEFGLAAGWQLALALGARPVVELGNGKEACLAISLPLEMSSGASVEEAPAAAPAPKFNGSTNVALTAATATATSF